VAAPAQKRVVPDAAAHIVPAPHCEFGCAATTMHRRGVDLARDVVGAQWSLEVTTRRLTTLPQPFLDRTDVALTMQGRGWKDAGTEITGVAIRDRCEPKDRYLQQVREALQDGGAVPLVDDSQVPWLDHAAWSHGLLPHALAVWSDDRPAERMTVVEGHAWWSGTYDMSYAQVLCAAFPEEDIHGVAGRFLAFDFSTEVPEPERLRRAANSLLSSAQHACADSAETTVTRNGTFTVAVGRPAVDLAAEAYNGLHYICRIAEHSAPLPGFVRDLEFGRYTFVRLAEELAFATYSRAATRSLLTMILSSGDPALEWAQDMAAQWRGLWKLAERLGIQPRVDLLDEFLRRWHEVASADIRAAARLAETLERSRGAS
jgi:hypothetical protein